MKHRHREIYGLLVGCMLVFAQWTIPKHASSIQMENQAEKEANLKGQIHGGLFHRWTFDQQKPEELPAGFSQVEVGGGPPPAWTIGIDPDAPSPPHILKAVSRCQAAPCYRMLIANRLQYEYPDVSVRLCFSGEGESGQGGLVIGLKDVTHFYAAIVDLAAKNLELVRMMDGQVTVLGQTPVTSKAVPWHSLRIQRNTIITKDFIEVFFDGALVLSVQDQSMGIGQVGVLVRGNSTLNFDSLHAVPLFSQRPLSAPAAY